MPPETEANVAEMVDAVTSDDQAEPGTETVPLGDEEISFTWPSDDPEPEPSPEAKTLEEIVERNRRGIEMHDAWQKLKKQAKAAGLVWEEHQEDTQHFIASFDEEYPLFDRKAQDAGVVADPSEGDQSWRSASILELGGYGLTPAVIVKLGEDGIGTMGTLADHTNSGKLLTDIPGVGRAKAEAIEAALEGFWAAQRTRTDAMLQAYCEGVEAKREADPDGGFDAGSDGQQTHHDPDAERAAREEKACEVADRIHDAAFPENRAADKPLSAYPDQPDAGMYRPPAEKPKRRKKGGAA